MSLFSVTNGLLWEAPRTQDEPRDPSRPSAPLRVVAGRERDAEQAAAAIAVIVRVTGDKRVAKDIEIALIRAGVLEVVR